MPLSTDCAVSNCVVVCGVENCPAMPGGGGQVAGDCQQGTELVCVMFYGQDANTAFSCPEADGFTLRDSVQPQVQRRTPALALTLTLPLPLTL